MNSEKASTLRLLREGMGQSVRLVQSRNFDAIHEVYAHLPEASQASKIPILFLITTLAFLEAKQSSRADADDSAMPDGWTPSDFLSHLRLEGGKLRIALFEIRGRAIYTDVSIDEQGDLRIVTADRGQSANRWLSFVEGRMHLKSVSATEVPD